MVTESQIARLLEFVRARKRLTWSELAQGLKDQFSGGPDEVISVGMFLVGEKYLMGEGYVDDEGRCLMLPKIVATRVTTGPDITRQLCKRLNDFVARVTPTVPIVLDEAQVSQ